ATTWAEYKKYFERDPALTRRFQVVKIEEPSESKAIDMMRAISVMLQNHHKVRILDEAIVYSVRLSSRYITARQLPDKSVSLLDTACARVALSQSATPASVEDTRRRITQTEANIATLERENATLGNCEDTIAQLTKERDELQQKLQQQEAQWQEEKAIVEQIHDLQNKIEEDFQISRRPIDAPENQDKQALSAEELQNVKTQLHELIAKLEKIQGDDPMIQINVGSQAIAEVVANWTGIPVGKMVANEIQQ